MTNDQPQPDPTLVRGQLDQLLAWMGRRAARLDDLARMNATPINRSVIGRELRANAAQMRGLVAVVRAALNQNGRPGAAPVIPFPTIAGDHR